MSLPFFSIVIPTKGRSFLVGHAIQSLLDQTFREWELTIADNDDGDATRNVVETFKDRRIRYLRTGGLSMTDNWESAAAGARGEYLCLLEDKQMLKPYALQRVKEEAAKNRATVVRWQSDTFDDENRPARIRRASVTGQATWRTSDDLLNRFTGSILGYKEILPLPQLSAYHRSLLQKVRSSPVGRLFPEVSPDISMGLMALSMEDRVLDLQSALVLYASTYHSNGRASHRKEASSRDFLKRLTGGEAMCFDHVPIKVLCMPSGVFNDFLRLRGQLPGRIADCKINWPHYFLECHRSMTGLSLSGLDMSVELADWRRALSLQPQNIQDEVAAALAESQQRSASPAGKVFKKLGESLGLPQLQRHAKHWIRGRLQGDPEWRFSTPSEYLQWEGRRPQPPVSR